MPFSGSAALGIMSGKKPYLSVSGELVLRRQRLTFRSRKTSESDLVSALPEALQFEVASEDDILENEAIIPVHENIASTAEDILEGIMTCRVQGAPLDDEQQVEEEEVDQQPPNRPPNHSEALQHVHSLMQFAQTNLPHLQPALINIYSEIERNWATANIQKKKQTTLHQFFTTPK